MFSKFEKEKTSLKKLPFAIIGNPAPPELHDQPALMPLGNQAGKNDGSVQGKTYFECEPEQLG